MQKTKLLITLIGNVNSSGDNVVGINLKYIQHFFETIKFNTIITLETIFSLRCHDCLQIKSRHIF